MRSALIIILALIAGFLYMEMVEAQTMDIKAYVDKKEISVVDTANYTIEVKTEPGIEIEFPPIAGQLQDFAVRDISEDKKEEKDGKVVYKKTYQVETFYSGDFKIPKFQIKARTPKGKEFTEYSPEVSIKVKPMTQGEVASDIRDIYPPVRFSGTYMWLYIAGIAVIAVLAGIFIWIRLRHRLETAYIRMPPHERAYEELKRLLDMKVTSYEEIKEYYSRLSNIVRFYIEERFSLRAPEETTEEFFLDVSSSNALSVRHKGLLSDFLSHCDMVKFARYGPTKEEIEKTFLSAKGFVDETREADEGEEEK